MGRGRRAALWAWEGVEAKAGATPSPGGRLVAVRAAGGVALLDAATGDCVVAVPGGANGTSPLSFSADGRWLAATDRGVLTAWDLEAGTAMPSVALAPGLDGPAVPLAGGRVRVADRVLEPATGHHGRVGTLGGGSAASVSAAGHVYAIAKAGGSAGKRDARYTLQRPDPAVGVDRLTLDTGLLLKEGDAVTLDLSGLSVSAEAREQLDATLNEQLTARGVEVAADRPVRLVATSNAETKTLTYETRGGFPGRGERTDVQATQTTLRFAIEADGVPAWEITRTVGSHAGGAVFLEEGQTIQQAVDAQGSVSGSPFGDLRLPDHIADPRPAADR